MAKIDISKAKQRLSSVLNIQTYGVKSRVSINEEPIEEKVPEIEFVDSFGLDTNDALYAFKADNKIIISSGDDNFKPMLGYFNIEEGDKEFSFNNLPIHVIDFLGIYADEIENYIVVDNNEDDSSDLVYGANESFKVDWQFVGRVSGGEKLGLVPYKWGQGYGYYRGYTTNSKKHEDYPDNKYIWYRDYQDEYIYNCTTDQLNSIDTEADNSSPRYTSSSNQKKSVTSTGAANYSFTFQSKESVTLNEKTVNLTLSHFYVLVDNTEWTRVTNFSSSGPNDQVYTIAWNSSYLVTVTFGDGINGKIPPDGKTITLKYGFSRKEYYGVSNDGYLKRKSRGETGTDLLKPNIKSVTGCPATAAAMIIAYWGTDGVKIKKNGIEQIKTYRIGSKVIPQQRIKPLSMASFSSGTRWFFLEMPELPSINSFDYDSFKKVGTNYTGYIKWYNSSTSTYNFEVDDNHNDIVNSYLTQDNKDQRTAIGQIMRYINQAIKSECTPIGTGAYVDDCYYYLREYLAWGKAVYRPNSSHSPVYLSSIDTFLDGSNAFLKGNYIKQTNASNSNYEVTSQTYLDGFEYVIYKELEKNIPVFFASNGVSSSGKDSDHAFVCDGYDPTNDTWHFNFGWWGTSNGWFTMRGTGNTQIHPSGKYYNKQREVIYRYYPNEYYNDFIEVTKNIIEFENIGGSDYLYVCAIKYENDSVTTNSSSTWNYSIEYHQQQTGWLTLSKSNAKLNISADQNLGNGVKTATIKVYREDDNTIYENVEVSVKGQGESVIYNLNISESNISFTSEGYTNEDYTVTITSNIGWEISNSSSIPNWITKYEKIGTDTLALRVSPNDSTTSKQFTLNIQTTDEDHQQQRSINISLAGLIINRLDVNETFINIDNSGGSGIIEVTSNIEWKVEYENKPDWVSSIEKDEETNKVNIVVLSSTSDNDQTYTFKIKPIDSSINLEQTITITLHAQYYLRINQNEIIFPYTGDTITIQITKNTDWAIDENTIPSWLTYIKSNNTVTFTAIENLGISDKIATIRIFCEANNNIYVDLPITLKGNTNIIEPTGKNFKFTGKPTETIEDMIFLVNNILMENKVYNDTEYNLEDLIYLAKKIAFKNT